MFLSEKQASERLNSPMNLFNKVKSGKLSSRKNAMNLFGVDKQEKDNKNEKVVTAPIKQWNPFDKKIEEVRTSIPSSGNSIIPAPISAIEHPDHPNIDKLIENNEAQVKLALAHDKSLELLTNSVTMLASKLDDVKADKLPGVISAASKVVESIRRERLEQSKIGKDREVHFHFYTPDQKKMADYGTIIEVTQ